MSPYLFAVEPALAILSVAGFALGRKVTVTRCAGVVGGVGLVVAVAGMAITSVLKTFGVL